ncbi:MAG: 3-keto-disaccharide hydrolase, partial [Planctomycetia bacterium]
KTGGPTNWKIEDGLLVSTGGASRTNHAPSKLHFRDAEIHVEFMVDPIGEGNSGIYLHGNFELQILDSYTKKKSGEPPTMKEMGSVYGFAAPLVNAARPAGEWQVYDIRYIAPRRGPDGAVVEKGVIDAWLNGQQVQKGTLVDEPRSPFHPYRYGPTPFLKEIERRQKETGVGPFFLQDHDSPTKFRNIWIRPLDDKAFLYEPKS